LERSLPPSRIGPFMSEVLTLGFEDERKAVVLVNVDRKVPNGARLM
jgi:tRNA-binding protein